MISPKTSTASFRQGQEGTRPLPGVSSAFALNKSASFSGLRKIPRSRPNHLLELACKVGHAAFGGVAFLSASGEVSEHLTWGVNDTAASELSHDPWISNLIHFALQQASPTRADSTDVFGPTPACLPPLGSVLLLPLARPGRFRGALYLVRPPAAPAFETADEELLLPIGAWLEEGSLFEEAHLLNQLRLLNQVAQAAAGNLNLGPLLEVALRELDRHLPMNVCAIWLVEEKKRTGAAGREEEHVPKAAEAPDASVEHLVLTATSGAQKDRLRDLGLVPSLRLPLLATPFGTCWQVGGAIYTAWGHPDRMKEYWQQPSAGPGEGPPPPAGTVPCFATPLRAGEQTVGILQCLCNRPTGFTSEQIQMLYLIADLLGPAITNCRLFGRLRATYEELRTTQEQLIRTEKMRALGEMASGMAHDFNNSLCGVLGFLELTLRDATLNSSSRAQLDLARTCALDAAETVRRVQDFARIRRNDLVFQPLDANALLRQTAELTRHRWETRAQAQGVSITLRLQTEASRHVMGNAAELREVFTNLIFNAVDAMPQGGTLTLRSWSEGSNVFLAVSDSGVGMSAAVQQRLFEPFFTTKGERGNGMGLSAAFGTVCQHGGEITVASEVGRGSTFTLRLSAAVAPDRVEDVRVNAPRSVDVKAPASVAKPVSPVGLRILVVEDEDAICRLMETVLTHLGHRPHVVRKGGAALEALAADSFDVVLTDLGLPDISGADVARAVAERSPATPVVLLTGWADQLKADARTVPGVTRILGKPVTLTCLKETLQAVCPR